MVRRARGYTLVEAMLASLLSLLIIAAAFQVLGFVVMHHHRDLGRAKMRQMGDVVVRSLAHDLRHAGLGVPSGPRASGAFELLDRIFVAETAEVALLADLARPESSLNGFSLLGGEQPGLAAAPFFVTLVNELTGECAVDLLSSPACTTRDSSLLVPASAGTGCAGSEFHPTCPWALQKYKSGDTVIVANGLGAWDEFTVDNPRHADGGDRRGLRLTAAPGHLTPTLPNRGFVSTIDRVFYRLNGDKVERVQCWGPLPSPLTASCPAGSNSLGVETLATGVTRFELTYATSQGTDRPAPVTAAADLRSIRRVHVALDLSTTVFDVPLSHTLETTVAVRR